MKLFGILLLVCAGLVDVVLGHFYVTAPNILRFERDETVIVGLLGEQDKTVEVWLENQDGKKFSEEEVFVANQENPASATIRVSLVDIVSEEARKNPKSVMLVARKDGHEQRAEVLLSYRTGHIVVQTDKPVYTPRQKVKVRVLAMDEDFKPAKAMNVTVDITSPGDVTFERYAHRKERNYFFDREFELPPFAEIGIWTVRAVYDGQYKTDGRALFAVEEYVLPTFFVKIRLIDSYYILPGEDDSEIKAEITAEYVYKEAVRGTVDLELSAVKDGEKEDITSIRGARLDNDGQKTFTIKKEDLCTYYDKACDRDRFPADYRLRIVARVTEGATGNQEAIRDESIMFAQKKYKVSFGRSKTSYRAGMTYYLKADLKYANGLVAVDEEVIITMNEGSQEKVVRTDERGRFSATFSDLQDGNLEFKVFVDTFESDVFRVTRFEGTRQISVEHVTANGQEMLRAYTNGQPGSDSGIVFMIVSNGQVIHTQYKKMQTIIPVALTNEIKQKIKSPNARLLVAFVDENNRLVADAIKFTLEKECEGKGLTLTADRTTINPGDKSDLTVSGDPHSLVGLNVMDSALLHVPNRQEILTVEKMLEVLDEHDIGCGEGSGATGEAVFKNSGLLILTDAAVQSDLLQRREFECAGKQRAKRSIEDMCPLCVELSIQFAEEHYYSAEDNGTSDDIDSYSACLAKTRQLAKDQTDEKKMIWKTKFLIAFFEQCVLILEELIGSGAGLAGKSLSETDRYTTLMKLMTDDGLNPGSNYVRENFAESWEFKIRDLDHDGNSVIKLNYPDSITTWLVQAIGITEDNGFCVAKPESVTAFRDFFLQVDLPYKAIRLEKMQIKATIFYYGDDERTVNVFLDYNPDYCSNSKLDRDQVIVVNMKPKSAETVVFPIIPIKQGKFEVVVRALSYLRGNTKIDGVKKHLYVVNEGVEEKINIQVCLDPKEQKMDCVNHRWVDTEQMKTQSGTQQYSEVTLENIGDHIPGTASVVGRLSTNVMEDVVQILIDGVDKLFIKPMGCGEQTVLRLAPNVYAMWYLKTTGRVTAAIEDTGHKFIQDGVKRELTYRKSNDGSYAAWLHRPSSTWLTAFVSKVFCQARGIDSTVAPLIEKNMPETIQWLIKQSKADGSFDEPLSVIHREMIGQLKETDPSLTAFVVISLAECSDFTKEAKPTIKKATENLSKLSKNDLQQNPYLLAISTYALALTNHEKKGDFKEWLMEIRKHSREGHYWGDPGGSPAHANSIETTSYALLALLLFDDIASAETVFSWLTSQRGVEGSFRTTQDTVVGLQALSAYTIKTNSPNVDLEVEIRSSSRASKWGEISHTLSNEHAQVVAHTNKLDVTTDDKKIIVDVKGTGTGLLTFDLRYNRARRANEGCQIDMSDVTVTQVDEQVDMNLAEAFGRKCDVCGHCEENPVDNFEEVIEILEEEEVEANFGRKRRNVQASQTKQCIKFNVRARDGAKYGMSIVKFWLETGQAVVESSLKNLKKSEIVENIELPENGKGYVTFYLSKIDDEEIPFTFILKDSFPGDHTSRQPAAVEVYDYYKPEIKCTKYYSTSSSNILDQQAQCDSTMCKCMQNMCAKDYKGVLTNKRKIPKPVAALVADTCNFKKADYAVLVKINTTAKTLDDKSGLVVAKGIVVQNGLIHEGAEALKSGSEMTFKWRPECPYLMKAFDGAVGVKQFYIIGKDGFKSKDGNGEEQFTYELMNTAIVLPLGRNRRSPYMKTMNKYVKYMQRSGCST